METTTEPNYSQIALGGFDTPLRTMINSKAPEHASISTESYHQRTEGKIHQLRRLHLPPVRSAVLRVRQARAAVFGWLFLTPCEACHAPPTWSPSVICGCWRPPRRSAPVRPAHARASAVDWTCSSERRCRALRGVNVHPQGRRAWPRETTPSILRHDQGWSRCAKHHDCGERSGKLLACPRNDGSRPRRLAPNCRHLASWETLEWTTKSLIYNLLS